ncbi:hypothetical protein F5B20DRAFT_505543 [Whalleya microplaca]|nr:hypothetical protein F5B20DRAFT_505543 [Whalleya microplaca]
MESSACDITRESRNVGKPNRTRPLRTYSKRHASVETGEPVAKKRRLEETAQHAVSETNATESPTHDASSPRPSSPPLPPAPAARKGTLMDYFKVIPSTSSSTLPSSDSAGPITTPPSSPPLPEAKRKTRRKLTTRAISLEAGTAVHEATDEDDGEVEGTTAVKDKPEEPRGQAASVADSSQDILKRGAKEKKRSDAGKRGRGARQAPRQTTVQTTLSLSLNEKVFEECKDCNMLYNPFHEKDAKYHAKLHAAMQKAKQNSENNISS